MLRKSQILSTLHQFPSKMYITYLPSHIHTIFKRFSPPTCLLDFTFCPSSMFIPSNMFIRFCLFALPTLLFHPTRLLGTLEYSHISIISTLLINIQPSIFEIEGYISYRHFGKGTYNREGYIY